MRYVRKQIETHSWIQKIYNLSNLSITYQFISLVVSLILAM